MYFICFTLLVVILCFVYYILHSLYFLHGHSHFALLDLSSMMFCGDFHVLSFLASLSLSSIRKVFFCCLLLSFAKPRLSPHVWCTTTIAPGAIQQSTQRKKQKEIDWTSKYLHNCKNAIYLSILFHLLFIIIIFTVCLPPLSFYPLCLFIFAVPLTHSVLLYISILNAVATSNKRWHSI